MVETLKELRLDIDAVAQLAENLFPIQGRKSHQDANWRIYHPKETEQTVDSLRMAKAWAGKALGSIGDPSPYKNDGKRREVKDIEPTDAAVTSKPQDIVNEVTYRQDTHRIDWSQMNHIQKVDWLRQEIQRLITNSESRFNQTPPSCRHEAVARTQIFVYLIEARFHLGFELQRIREGQ